jgi:hypothetical protein
MQHKVNNLKPASDTNPDQHLSTTTSGNNKTIKVTPDEVSFSQVSPG